MGACIARVWPDDQTQLTPLWSSQAWPGLYRERGHWLLTTQATWGLDPVQWGQAKTPPQTLLSGSWEDKTQSRARSRTDVCWMGGWTARETERYRQMPCNLWHFTTKEEYNRDYTHAVQMRACKSLKPIPFQSTCLHTVHSHSLDFYVKIHLYKLQSGWGKRKENHIFPNWNPIC